MKTFLLAAVASIGLAAAASAAPVTGQISLGGYAQAVGSTGMGSSTGISFASGALPNETISGTSGSLYSFGAGSGSFAALACAGTTGSCGTIKNLPTFSTGAINSFLTLNTSGGPTVSFDLASISSVSHTTDAQGGSVTFTAQGTINFTGYDATAGQFILTAQGNNIVSFSATTLAAAAVPEPASLALLGGALATVGFIRRRKSV